MMMNTTPEWIWNGYAWKWMASALTAAVGLAMVGMVILSVTVYRLSALQLLVVGLVGGGVVIGGLVYSQPLRVGFVQDRLLVRWLWKTDIVILPSSEEATFSLMARHVGRQESRRLYTILIKSLAGRPISLGNVTGPIARRILDRVGPEKIRLVVYGRGRYGDYRVKR